MLRRQHVGKRVDDGLQRVALFHTAREDRRDRRVLSGGRSIVQHGGDDGDGRSGRQRIDRQLARFAGHQTLEALVRAGQPVRHLAQVAVAGVDLAVRAAVRRRRAGGETPGGDRLARIVRQPDVRMRTGDHVADCQRHVRSRHGGRHKHD